MHSTPFNQSLFVLTAGLVAQVLLTKKELELHTLQADLLRLQAEQASSTLRSPLTHLQFYRGKDGVKQMLWNETRGKSENLSILFENMQERTNATFFERWTERMNQADTICRSIVGDHFLETQRRWYDLHTNENLAHRQGRYLPSHTFLITHSMATYDDVVAYYNWKNGEIFGIEVYNAEIAMAQRQFFEMLWVQGRPVSGHGAQPLQAD